MPPFFLCPAFLWPPFFLCLSSSSFLCPALPLVSVSFVLGLFLSFLCLFLCPPWPFFDLGLCPSFILASVFPSVLPLSFYLLSLTSAFFAFASFICFSWPTLIISAFLALTSVFPPSLPLSSSPTLAYALLLSLPLSLRLPSLTFWIATDTD